MAKKDYNVQSKEKCALGKLISNLRNKKGLSLRKFAEVVGLSPSNITYIEKGINVPTGEIYQKIIANINPDVKTHKEMDSLYMTIRKLPPPDICEVLINNPKLIEKIRKENI